MQEDEVPAGAVNDTRQPADETLTWRRRISVEVRGWLRTYAAIVIAPRRLRAPETAATLNSPLRQLLGSLFLIGMFAALTGVDLQVIDKAFELPPALGGLPSVMSKIPGLDVTIVAALYAALAAPTWLVWRIFERRASFSVVYRAQMFIAAASLPIIYLLGMVRGILITFTNFTYFPPVFEIAAVVLPIWMLIWVARQVSLESATPWWKYIGAGFVVGAAFLAINEASPLKWPPKRNFAIPSSSMTPTLKPGDQIVTNNWVYHWRKPRRGDVVVFRTANAPLVSRIVGLPKDKVQVNQGVVLVNGEPLKRQNLGIVEIDEGGYSRSTERMIESTLGGRKYMIQDFGPDGEGDAFGPATVPVGHYLMLGDSRDNALDSRFAPPVGPGFVKREDIIGMVYLRIFPFGRPLDALETLDEERQ